MAGKSHYTDDQRARVNMVLTVHDGNVKRTSRETGVPEATIRLWKKRWEQGGLPAEVNVKTNEQLEKFVLAATEVRDLATERLKWAIPQLPATKALDLAKIAGIFDDKLRLAQGRPTSIKQTNTAQTDPAQVQALFKGFISEMLEASRARDYDIETADVIEVE